MLRINLIHVSEGAPDRYFHFIHDEYIDIKTAIYPYLTNELSHP